MVLTLPFLWAAASGLALVLLGLALLALRPRRAANAVFAAACLAWGCNVLLANAASLAYPHPAVPTLLRLGLAFSLLTQVFVAYFPTIHPRRATGPLAAAVPVAFLGLAGVAVAYWLVEPGAFLRGVRPVAGGQFVPDFGPAATPLVVFPFFAAFDVAVLWMLREYLGARGTQRQQARLLLAGFLLFVAYANAQLVATLATTPALVQGLGPMAWAWGAMFGGGVLLSLGVAARLAWPAPPEGRDPLLLGAALVPMGVALLEQAVGALAGSAWFSTYGFWRLGTVGLVAYAMARYQLFDLDLRLRGLSARALPWGAALLAGLVALTALEGAGPVPMVLGALAAAAPAGLAARAWREPAARRLFPAQPEDPAYLYHRKLEVYRATLERALAEAGPGPLDEAPLRALRRSLGLGEREAQVLEYVVRQGLGARGLPGDMPPGVAPGALLLGRYRVERLLGEGAHGRAYLARDETLGREVVVKAVGTSVLGGRAAQLLLREARLAGSLRHPNIVQVHDVAETPHEALIVMEYCDGGSLHGLLRRRGRLGPAEAAALLDQVLAGLGAAHAKGIVHRDVKPENLLLMRDGTVKVADFGVAREQRPDATGITQGAALGTLLYMSPEQVRGLPVDARSDLYAAAVVLHQALTGRFYLRVAGKDDFQLRQLILRGDPALPAGPAWAREVLQRALAKDPARRFPDAAAMRAALRAALPGPQAPVP